MKPFADTLSYLDFAYNAQGVFSCLYLTYTGSVVAFECEPTGQVISKTEVNA